MSEITSKSLRTAILAMKKVRQSFALDHSIAKTFGVDNPTNQRAVVEYQSLSVAIGEMEEVLEERRGKR